MSVWVARTMATDAPDSKKRDVLGMNSDTGGAGPPIVWDPRPKSIPKWAP